MTKTIPTAALVSSLLLAAVASVLAQVDPGEIPGAVADSLCTACATCDALGPLCDDDLVRTIACNDAYCEFIGGEELCMICNICEAIDNATAADSAVCDINRLTDLGCGFCPEEEEEESSSPSCFSADTTVQVQVQGNAMAKTMKDLHVGDRILTSSGNYETVYAFGHYHPAKWATFLQIHSSSSSRSNSNNEKPLEVTPDHLVFVQGQNTPIPAKDIQVGDNLIKLIGSDSATVTKITTTQKQGIYAPLTTSGNLVVNGVVASSYVRAQNSFDSFLSDHTLVHILLSPYRIFCSQAPAAFCGPSATTTTNDGMPLYAHFGMNILLPWVAQQNKDSFFHNVILTLLVVLAGICHALELLLGGPNMAPLVAMGLGYATYHAVLLYHHNRRRPITTTTSTNNKVKDV